MSKRQVLSGLFMVAVVTAAVFILVKGLGRRSGE